MPILPPTTENIIRASEAIKSGDLVALPTETVYGLGANAFDGAACAKIFALKGRPPTDPLIVHVHTRKDVYSVADVGTGRLHQAVDALINAFWPGPLTLVLPASKDVPEVVTAGRGTVGVRMPRHPVASSLIAETGTPIAAPSANRFGSISPTTAESVALEFEGSDLLILDGGCCSIGLESTIVQLSPMSGTILRYGRISSEEISAVLTTSGLIGYTLTALKVSASPAAKDTEVTCPGQFLRHYSPDRPTYLLCRVIPDLPGATQVLTSEFNETAVTVVDCNTDNVEFTQQEYLELLRGAGFRENIFVDFLQAYKTVDEEEVFWSYGDGSKIEKKTSSKGTTEVSTYTSQNVAQGLYQTLRTADATSGMIVVIPPKMGFEASAVRGLDAAILDRCFRAASGKIILLP
ncbi:SUA5 protein [Giardia muris]|uniref:Threonylcarbamoyl-AMP synthase n=1 Tax=Giardia muris TaxID=5742 RepID=A0A4Z1T9V9_GIAMU|nr:SUA5 protein [Giardia muris]|eukprot:TNJ29997.1 SUA5 protein [Giardia muris]